MPIDTTEKKLEERIEDALTSDKEDTRTSSSPEEVRDRTGAYGQFATGGFRKHTSSDYDTEFGLIRSDLFEFIQNSQTETWNDFQDFHGDRAKREFLEKLNQNISRHGTIDVLRNGFNMQGGRFDQLAYFKPANELNPDLVDKYEANIFSVVRQLQYRDDTRQAPDMTLFLNGLPIFTIELKNLPTGQSVEDAKKQYRKDRDPREPLFSPGRCLAHFAVDTEEIYMTTELAGDDTEFLPFNRGHNKGAGNPPNPHGVRTSYLWNYVLTQDSILNLVENFIHEFEEQEEDGDAQEKTLIFPRYHQLETVRNLISDVSDKGVGERYLIQHSAGSGKTFSISWLAHQLATLHDDDDTPFFDTVIVISDRRYLDDQLQNHIRQFEETPGMVANIDEHSSQLKEALEAGKQIVVSTLQKFPHIVDEVSEMVGSSFAIIIDEAHSSQTGKLREKMNEVLSERGVDVSEEDGSIQDIISDDIDRRSKLDNASSFAFTATPKERTLEMFGDKQPDGSYEPFSLYSMRQAIDEGFIMDVLQNYTTYQEYFRLLKTVEDNPNIDSGKATKLLKKFVQEHDHVIDEKTRIIVEHFHERVADRVAGKARAMVVTGSRQQAARYKLAIDEYMDEQGYTYETLVAFTDSVDIADEEYTEDRLNGNLQESIEDAFRKKNRRILVVADKFQTGFDEPMLHTMYVDKKLGGVNAVQTLSRLNRTHPDKDETMVLDFVNDREKIQDAFDRFYGKTRLTEGTDPNLLYELERSIRDYRFFSDEEQDQFAELWYPGAELEEIHAVVDPAIERYEDVEEEQQDKFRHDLKEFIQLYSYLLKVVSIEDEEMDKLYQFGRLMYRKLDVDRSEMPVEVKQYVDLESYRVEETVSDDIELDEDEGELDAPHRTKYEGDDTEELDPLSKIIQRLNELFGADLGEEDKVFIQRLRKRLRRNAGLRNMVDVNPEDKARRKFDQVVDKEMVDMIDVNMDFYNRTNTNDDLKNILFEWLFNDFQKRDQSKAEELIATGENNKVEFRETFLYDVNRNKPNEDLKKEAVKQICAFANSRGGTLIIGVRDEDEQVTGLEWDFKVMQEQKESFELQLNQEISEHLGDVFVSQLVDVRFEEVEGNTVCAIEVQPGDEPVFYDEEDFYIRRSSATVRLDDDEREEYIEKHF
jgi:type I restriction enzyme R subunit